MKKLALIFFGISYLNTEKKLIDYRNSVENYKEIMFRYFKNLGYEIDIYLCTNELNENIKNELINIYKPKKYSFINNLEDRLLSRNNKIKFAVKSCIDSNIQYNTVLVVRFDLLFKKKFSESNIDLNKFNLVYSHQQYICDNFYLFPYSKLLNFYNLLCKNNNIQSHLYKNQIESMTQVNYMCGIDNGNSALLNPFYVINRNTNTLNKNNFMLHVENQMVSIIKGFNINKKNGYVNKNNIKKLIINKNIHSSFTKSIQNKNIIVGFFNKNIPNRLPSNINRIAPSINRIAPSINRIAPSINRLVPNINRLVQNKIVHNIVKPNRNISIKIVPSNTINRIYSNKIILLLK